MRTMGQRRPGSLPIRPAELLQCPRCGYDLDKARLKVIGDLWADPRGDTFWKKQPVFLSSTERLLLHALITPQYQSTLMLAEKIDSTPESVKIVLSKMRMSFRRVDPAFDHVELQAKAGWRWKPDGPQKKVIARTRRTAGRCVLYDNGEVIWKQRYRVFLTPGDQVTLMKALIDTEGEFTKTRQMDKIFGRPVHRQRVERVAGMIRRRFREIDPNLDPIEGKKHHGYRLV